MKIIFCFVIGEQIIWLKYFHKLIIVIKSILALFWSFFELGKGWTYHDINEVKM